MFHNVKSVTPLSNYRLLVHFIDESNKVYDMKPLIKNHPKFADLKNIPGLFDQVKADVGGYGIVWNEYIDIDAEEVYRNGKNVKNLKPDEELFCIQLYNEYLSKPGTDESISINELSRSLGIKL